MGLIIYQNFTEQTIETHMEVYVHLYSYKNRQTVALKVKIDRDKPTIESLAATVGWCRLA